jgi:hypothetical protein
MDERVTTGLFYDTDGTKHEFVSARDTASDLALKVGRDAGVFPSSGRPVVVDHVEVKVAAAMRNSGEKAGVLLINNSSGPCRRNAEGDIEPASCLAFLPRLLPTGATLTVWWPDPSGGSLHRQLFVGGQP